MDPMANDATDELFLGYDARIAPVEWKDRWTPAAAGWLLRHDVVVPLSVDYLIWPSAWRIDDEVTGWRGPVQGLWVDLRSLKSHLLARRGHWWIIAIFLKCRSLLPVEQDEWRQRTRENKIAPNSGHWKSLGYDVADRFLTSSLFCSRPGEDFALVERDWAAAIDEHHLFSDLDTAEGFRKLSDRRIPEHAPHFVYELTLVDSVTFSP